MTDISKEYWNDKRIQSEKPVFRELLNYSSPEKLKGEHLESYNHAVELIEKYSLLTSSVLL